MNFKEMLKEKSSHAEEILYSFMPKEEGYQKTVIEAMNYSLKAGGKRLRPVLLLEFCKIFGGDVNSAKAYATAIEMIHTYSLIHDDLPALDDDELRRGKPTNHVMFGEAMAILAGDALLNYAYELMINASIDKGGNYIKAAHEIAKGAGIYGMVGGQVVDVESEKKTIGLETLKFIHLNKTAAMIIGACLAGAYIGGANEEQIEIVKIYARNIGLAFQIEDDILDIVGDEKKLGKKVGSDIKMQKATYPSLLGMDESIAVAKELIEDAKSSLSKLEMDTEFLSKMADYIISRDH